MFNDLGFENLILMVLFPAAMAFVAASDLLTMRISNKISLLLIAGFVVMAPLAGFDLPTAGSHLAAGATVLVLGFACFSFGWMGGGDAKIAAVTALWFGWFHTFEFLLVAGVLGGVLTFAILFMRKVPLPETVTNVEWIGRLYAASNGVPYGIALAAGALIVYPDTIWMAPLAN